MDDRKEHAPATQERSECAFSRLEKALERVLFELHSFCGTGEFTEEKRKMAMRFLKQIDNRYIEVVCEYEQRDSNADVIKLVNEYQNNKDLVNMSMKGETAPKKERPDERVIREWVQKAIRDTAEELKAAGSKKYC